MQWNRRCARPALPAAFGSCQGSPAQKPDSHSRCFGREPKAMPCGCLEAGVQAVPFRARLLVLALRCHLRRCVHSSPQQAQLQLPVFLRPYYPLALERRRRSLLHPQKPIPFALRPQPPVLHPLPRLQPLQKQRDLHRYRPGLLRIWISAQRAIPDSRAQKQDMLRRCWWPWR